MTEITNCFNNKIKMGAQQSYKNLTMFPLLTGYSIPSNYSIPGNYLTMNEPLLKCNTEQNRSADNTIRNHGNDRIAAAWDYTEQFARVDGQIGAVFLINGKLAGVVCFRGPEAFKKSFIKIVECYAKKSDDEYDPAINLNLSSAVGLPNYL